jgi:hypothetical protein
LKDVNRYNPVEPFKAELLTTFGIVNVEATKVDRSERPFHDWQA